MTTALQDFCLKVNGAVQVGGAANFRPPSWPPPPDWPVVIDKEGKVISVWRDPIWDLTCWAGTPVSLNFGDMGKDPGRSAALDDENGHHLRLATGWLIWGPRGVRSAMTIKNRFTSLRPIFELCSSNGIPASSLMRFPAVSVRLPEVIAPSRWAETLTLLHTLFDARHALGFTVLEPKEIKRLAEAAAAHETVQTPYIPPRIWTYQVSRLRACLDEFLAKQDEVEACFQFCLKGYTRNFSSLELALEPKKDGDKGPFSSGSTKRPGCTYLGTFLETARRFEVESLLTSWIEPSKKGWRASHFSMYLSLVVFAGLAYIANFTLQRKEEVGALRADCLHWESDEKLGRVPIIAGETTKTQPDSDARWVASPSVEVAVRALTVIARLRMICDAANSRVNPTREDKRNPFLYSTPTEPWGFGVGWAKDYQVRSPVDDIKSFTERYPKLFGDELIITAEDLELATRMTPNLPQDSFAVGKMWPLAWHQFRRTTAVNMFSSGVLSDSSMQQLMKHCNRLMPIYYGRGHNRLRLNEEVEQAVVKAMYEGMANRMKHVVTERFVFPNPQADSSIAAVNLISTTDVKTLSAWSKAGRVAFRENRLGGCMKQGACDYGGVESVARCAGGDGGKPCTDAVYDREKEPQVRRQLQEIDAELSELDSEAPRFRALQAERLALENYLNAITKSQRPDRRDTLSSGV